MNLLVRYLCVCVFSLNSYLQASNLSYYFVRFEEDEGFSIGGLVEEVGLVQAVEGHVEVKNDEDLRVRQYLSLKKLEDRAIFRGEILKNDYNTSYYELWVRPSVVDEGEILEFVDIDGALVGFRRDEHRTKGVFYVNHAGVENESGIWISTKAEVPLNEEGVAAEWIKLQVVMNMKSGRWDLKINEELVIEGVQAWSSLEEESRIWFYGKCDYDDILVTSDDPSIALDLFQSARKVDKQSQVLHENSLRVFGKGGRRRLPQISKIEKSEVVKPVVHQISTTVVNGGVQHGSFEHDGMTLSLYTPSYDEGGNVQPMSWRVDCSADLKAGALLSDIGWKVECASGPNNGKTILSGDFRDGLSKIIEIPAEYAASAIKIIVRVKD